MDPDEALVEFLSACGEHRHDDATEALGNLLGWLKSGGFLPSDPRVKLRQAADLLRHLAASRLEDMHIAAEDTHGEGFAYRCACYRVQYHRFTEALIAMNGSADAEFHWLLQMARGAWSDPGQRIGICSTWGSLCVCSKEHILKATPRPPTFLPSAEPPAEDAP